MNTYLNIFIYMYPLIVIIASIMTLNTSDANRPIISKKWLYISWVNAGICLLGWICLSFGMHYFSSISTGDANYLSGHFKGVYLVAFLVLIFLRRFKGVLPTKVESTASKKGSSS